VVVDDDAVTVAPPLVVPVFPFVATVPPQANAAIVT
jgi:hypothetical protein